MAKGNVTYRKLGHSAHSHLFSTIDVSQIPDLDDMKEWRRT